MTIGERIKNRREELGLSQEELAKKMGFKTKNSIYKYEQQENMKSGIIQRFADALSVSPAYLMGWEDNAPVYNALKRTSNENDALLNAYEQNKLQNSIKLTIEDVELIKDCQTLNEDGRKRVTQYVGDLMKIDEYKKL